MRSPVESIDISGEIQSFNGQPSYDLAYCCLLIFLYFNFYVEPWDRETFLKWLLSRKGQEAAKRCPRNRG